MEIFRGIAALGLPKPTFSIEEPNFLQLTIPLSVEAATVSELSMLNPVSTASLDALERRGLAFLVRSGGARRDEYAREIEARARLRCDPVTLADSERKDRRRCSRPPPLA